MQNINVVFITAVYFSSYAKEDRELSSLPQNYQKTADSSNSEQHFQNSGKSIMKFLWCSSILNIELIIKVALAILQCNLIDR